MKERRVSSPFVSALRTIMEVFISLRLVAANYLMLWQPPALNLTSATLSPETLSPVGASAESRGSRRGCRSEIQTHKLSVSRHADVCQWAAPDKILWFIMCINDSLHACDCTTLWSQVVVPLCLGYISLTSSLEATRATDWRPNLSVHLASNHTFSATLNLSWRIKVFKGFFSWTSVGRFAFCASFKTVFQLWAPDVLLIAPLLQACVFPLRCSARWADSTAVSIWLTCFVQWHSAPAVSSVMHVQSNQVWVQVVPTARTQTTFHRVISHYFTCLIISFVFVHRHHEMYNFTSSLNLCSFSHSSSKSMYFLRFSFCLCEPTNEMSPRVPKRVVCLPSPRRTRQRCFVTVTPWSRPGKPQLFSTNPS